MTEGGPIEVIPMDLQALNSVVQSGELFLAFGNETENEKGPETLQFWARLWPNLLHSEIAYISGFNLLSPHYGSMQSLSPTENPSST